MKLTELERRRAYKKAFELLDKINELLLKARAAHYKATDNSDDVRKAA